MRKPLQQPARAALAPPLRMKRLLQILFLLVSPLITRADNWPLERVDNTLLPHGSPKTGPGVVGSAQIFDGQSAVELAGSASLCAETFSITLWFNPYELRNGQQLLAGKNRYSLQERQWSLCLEANGQLKAHIRQTAWSTIACDAPLNAGAWHQAVLVVEPNKASLFLNGKPAGEVHLKTPVPATNAPITLGGIWDANAVHQGFRGALDEFVYEPHARRAEEIAAAYQPVLDTHPLPRTATAAWPLWDETQTLPKSADLHPVKNARFHVIKKQRPDEDGCKWTLGVGLAWHKGRLYASYGYNTGAENTPTEEAHVRVSEDGGKTWSRTTVMDSGEGDLGVSHGVFLSHAGALWAFMGAFYAHSQPYHRVHTRAYVLNEDSGTWEPRGAVLEGGFWPMQEPVRMGDGNWIMSGLRIAGAFGGEGNLPAVAISRGDDFSTWDLRVIAAEPGLGGIWGESTVVVEGNRILNMSRYGKQARALLSISEDHGRTWTPAAVSNLPMATSKPYAGILSNGQRFLVCTTTADTGGARSPLTIAVSRPGESVFSRVYLIRRSLFPEGPGVSGEKVDFSYPYAVEHAGNLYIGYTHKSHAANELAIVPVSSLCAPP